MRLTAIVTMGAVLVGGASGAAEAQNRCDALKLQTAAGIGLKIAKTTIQQALIVQLVATNDTGGRVYVKSAQWGEGIKPSSGSGVEWFTAVAHGIETTQGFPGTTCLNNPGCARDLNGYSPIEPHGNLRFTYQFGSMLPLHPSDDISFLVELVTRFGQSAPTLLKFSFDGVPVSCL